MLSRNKNSHHSVHSLPDALKDDKEKSTLTSSWCESIKNILSEYPWIIYIIYTVIVMSLMVMEIKLQTINPKSRIFKMKTVNVSFSQKSIKSTPLDKNIETAWKKPDELYYTCEEFAHEYDGYNEKFVHDHVEVEVTDRVAFLPGYSYFCGQLNIYRYLKNECYVDKNNNKNIVCPHPRYLPSWNYSFYVTKHKMILRRMLKVLSLFEDIYPMAGNVIIGGTLMGYLRQGDVIPHDEDSDVIMSINGIKQLVYQADKLPADIDFLGGDSKKTKAAGWNQLMKMVDLNSCLMNETTNFFPTPPIYLDIIPVRALFQYWKDFETLDYAHDENFGLPRKSRTERKYITLNYQSTKLNIPKNWAITFGAEKTYKKYGSRILTYVPFKLDNGIRRNIQFSHHAEYANLYEDQYTNRIPPILSKNKNKIELKRNDAELETHLKFHRNYQNDYKKYREL